MSQGNNSAPLTFAQILRKPPEHVVHGKETSNPGGPKRKRKGEIKKKAPTAQPPRILKRGEVVESNAPQIETCSIFDFITTSEAQGKKSKRLGYHDFPFSCSFRIPKG